MLSSRPRLEGLIGAGCCHAHRVQDTGVPADTPAMGSARRLMLAIAAAALCGSAAAAAAAAPPATRPAAHASARASIPNLTGLPAYPNLEKASMDDVYRTEALGRWCARFVATTADSLRSVEDWYRKTLARASETDLAHDERFKAPTLSGIKLATGDDYVALYRLANQPTTIELHRCSWNP